MGETTTINGMPFFAAQKEYDHHREEFESAVVSVFQHGRHLQGTEIAQFENLVAQRTGRKHAVAVGSCTDALHFSLIAGGIKPGDEVLVTCFSFIASVSCIIRAGAIPVFVDIGEDFQTDLDKAASLITDKTKAILYVQLLGNMGRPKDVEAFADKHNLLLIEDAAQSLGSAYNGQRSGSVGSVSCFSFDPTKVLSAPGSGGLALTDDPAVAEEIRRLRYHGKQNGCVQRIGFNSQMSSITASLLTVKLAHDDEWRKRRGFVARRYKEQLRGLGIEFPPHPTEVEHAYHKFVLRHPWRDTIVTQLKKRSIPVMIHYDRLIPDQPALKTTEHRCGDLTTAKAVVGDVFSLPVHPFVTDDEIDFICMAVRNVVNSL